MKYNLVNEVEFAEKDEFSDELGDEADMEEYNDDVDMSTRQNTLAAQLSMS